MTTILTTGHSLMHTKDERLRILAALRHLGSGADLRDFPASPSEKVALVRTASQRRLIVWHKGRSRYQLTPAGWCALAPSRRFGVGSMMLGTGLGATLGAAALAVFWFATGPVQKPLAPRAAVAQVAKASAPAVAKPAAALSTAMPAAPPQAATPAGDAAPAAAPVEAEPAKVAQEPTPEQLAEAAKARQAAAKKARARAAARRKREEAARAWAAADPSRSRQEEYSGYGRYGGQNGWFAYR